jgi:hypothetical protein
MRSNEALGCGLFRYGSAQFCTNNSAKQEAGVKPNRRKSAWSEPILLKRQKELKAGLLHFHNVRAARSQNFSTTCARDILCNQALFAQCSDRRRWPLDKTREVSLV